MVVGSNPTGRAIYSKPQQFLLGLFRFWRSIGEHIVYLLQREMCRYYHFVLRVRCESLWIRGTV
ncbi:hypothetical protein AL536_22670 [Vibrio fluvialis]|uniref:DUF3265 domain-containing protein n=1 Tax=Vibrio fluvialis TaxID=676 RepID=A0ABN5GVK6_VIBFL|nr:hypothetical protein AL536_22670 [Vibrio fluvialis]EKO3995804.1 hypothetical protein [Vibrio fluvialis]EKO4008047.1 hypothetical protein [Vibrio fluvialis]